MLGMLGLFQRRLIWSGLPSMLTDGDCVETDLG